MSDWIVKVTVIMATVVLVSIRAPHGQRSLNVPVQINRKGTVEIVLLLLASVSFLIPLLWIVLREPAFAEYTSSMWSYLLGVVCYSLGLWIFYRSHADLGTNWSITLQIREQHELITDGMYAWVRHPMYLGLLLFSLGQALVLPNWVAGLSYGVAIAAICIFRIGPEEQLMKAAFGPQYVAYASATNRLIPYLW